MADSEKALPSQPPPKPQASADKVLRIGIVQAGKVVHERYIYDTASLAVAA